MTHDPRKRAILLGGQDAMDVDEDVAPSFTATTAAGVSTSASSSNNNKTSTQDDAALTSLLITPIIQPSPYPQHNSGPTSSRFRNALNRVTTVPDQDIEAWQALITEVQSCYRNNIRSIHAVDADTHAKLTWVESCYGMLLQYFPYAVQYQVVVAEMLLGQSARVGEVNGPLTDYGMDVSQRSVQCEAKLERLLQDALGVDLQGNTVVVGDDGNNADNSSSGTTTTPSLGGMSVWVIDLWLLYIKKRTRDATRKSLSMPPDERSTFCRQATLAAYETAVTHAGFCHENHTLWKDYITFVRSWVTDATANTNHALAQQQMVQLRAVYQRATALPMMNLEALWHEYEAFERGQSEALAQALTQEFQPKYQHARTIYLERNRVYSTVELQLGRLATPPVSHTASSGAEEDDEYAAKMNGEYKLLALWKKRCSYERTNPERLSAQDLAVRIRYTYKEMTCVLMRHPECWHMWSTWELLAGGGAEGGATRSDLAVAVLKLGQVHVPDSTMLAYAEAQALELHTETPKDCMRVMEAFLNRSPNTLGFILYQQMVRRYKGTDEARSVFARARRTLVDFEGSGDQGAASANAAAGDDDKEAAEGDGSGKKEAATKAKRWMVTNRLDPSIGSQRAERPLEEATNAQDGGVAQGDASNKPPPGIITWHLYASHASMEHRLNKSPEVAARVYELGLRKHAAFLTKPPFVQRYAQLLLVLGDTMNLRALLTRAVAACEAQEKTDALAALWDVTLQFESMLSGVDQSSVLALETVEKRRREALMGPTIEDVATGGFVGVGEGALIGAQKSTIGEQLVRSEGYDISSRIVNGMSRTVDVLEVMGLWGNGEADAAKTRGRTKQSSSTDKDAEISGGKSDASYQKRLKFQSLAASGMSANAAIDGGAAGGSKLLSARERLLQGAGGAAAAPGQSSAMMLAIQQAPEWLRPLLLILPASRLRLPVVAKPPPHMVEMALGKIRQNPLPAERPLGGASKMNGKRKANNGGDSSDEENGGNRGGYGSQFRSRQRARMATSGQTRLSD